MQPITLEVNDHSFTEDLRQENRPSTVARSVDRARKPHVLPKKDEDSNKLNMDKITPEQAAQIVKRFVLPMFDTTKKLAQKSLQ